MRKLSLLAALFVLTATPALADLKVGANAPDFTLPATLGGKEFTFHLADALKKGPVVVYFYPAAFTHGCTIEAHDFAEAMPDFRAAGASVIGVSHDDIATLNKFSVSECQSKFPVAADRDKKVMGAYDATMLFGAVASRTSYVIAPSGKIVFAYSDMAPEDHITGTLKAVRKLKSGS
ncbi:MAG: peroxiredoxin [Alphaproteobacteria bacterium]|nr:peroxiredoxin [Alphaproteobacteria bacterium]